MNDKTKIAKAIEQHKEFIQTLNPKLNIVTSKQQPRPFVGLSFPDPDYDSNVNLFIDYTSTIISD